MLEQLALHPPQLLVALIHARHHFATKTHMLPVVRIAFIASVSILFISSLRAAISFLNS